MHKWTFKEQQTMEEHMAAAYEGKRYYKVLPQHVPDTKYLKTVYVLTTLGKKICMYEDGLFRRLAKKRRR